jgi:hypothetical protein
MCSRSLPLSVAFVGMILSGCASREAAATGAGRPLVATIVQDEAREIRVVSIDGRRVPRSRGEIELPPGTRTIELIYTPPKTAHSYPVRITFNAEAGHYYALSAKVLHGRDAGTGYWEGKYQAFIYDLSPVREVGRSPGPPAPGPKANRG